MLAYELWVLVVDMSAEASVKVNEATLIAEITETIHDLFQALFIGDLVLQHLPDQFRILGIRYITQFTDLLDDILEILQYALVVIHLSAHGFQSSPTILLFVFCVISAETSRATGLVFLG